MKIEIFLNITIAYMRNVGEYGDRNKELMEKLKAYLSNKNLLNDDAVILGIALDNPSTVPKESLRYDVGIIIGNPSLAIDLEFRQIDDGQYAIFEVPHTKEDVVRFWNNIGALTSGLSIDINKPIIERYKVEKIKENLCEFCIPLKE